MQRVLVLAVSVFLWGSLLPLALADSGFIVSLSVTAAPGAGVNEANVTVTEQTLTSTSYPPTSPTFGGTVDFGDGAVPAATAGFPMNLTKQQLRRGKGGTVVSTNTLQAMLSHTYPAPGTYKVTASNCCEAEIALSYGYVFATSNGMSLTDMRMVTVGAGAACREPTLFAQINCLFDVLIGAVKSNVSDAALSASFVSRLGNAQARKEDAEAACLANNPTLATQKINVSKGGAAAFVNSVQANTGPGRRIPDADAGADLMTKGNGIVDAESALLADGVCILGFECLPDPPLGAINCQLDKLIAAVTAAGLDDRMARALLNLLNQAQDQKERAEDFCEAANRDRQATGRIKAVQAKMKAFANRLAAEIRKGNLSQAQVNGFMVRVNTINGFIAGLLQNGVCA